MSDIHSDPKIYMQIFKKNFLNIRLNNDRYHAIFIHKIKIYSTAHSTDLIVKVYHNDFNKNELLTEKEIEYLNENFTSCLEKDLEKKFSITFCSNLRTTE